LGNRREGFGPKNFSAPVFKKRADEKVVVKRISAMGSPKIRRAPRGSWGEKRGRAASYRDKEFFFENVAAIFFPKFWTERRGPLDAEVGAIPV
jgi:hypothetical protein